MSLGAGRKAILRHPLPTRRSPSGNRPAEEWPFGPNSTDPCRSKRSGLLSNGMLAFRFCPKLSTEWRRQASALQRGTAVLLLAMVLGEAAGGCASAPRRPAEAAPTPPRLFLRSGDGRNEYLGCLTCDERDVNSIANPNGPYGHDQSELSIWNPQGPYGSPASEYSPWNRSGSSPPRIVDAEGNFYGMFTVNRNHPLRTEIPAVLELLDAYRR